MLRARRLVTLWQRTQPQTDASLTRLSQHLARVNIRTPSTLPQHRWMSQESMTQVPFQTDEAMTKLLEELDGYRDTGNWRQALRLLDRVDKDDALPKLDSAMYERAMAACARMGKVEVLPGLLNNMLVDNLTPTSATMDFIIQAYLAKEHWGLIVQLACEATALGVHLSPAAFHAIMEACGQVKDADSAMAIMTQLSEAGMELAPEHYASAIRAAGMGRKPDVAMAMFVHMEDRDGVKATPDAFSQLIRTQVLNQKMDQALQTFMTATQRKMALEESIYTLTIDSLVTNGRYWQATQLFEQMLENGEKHPTAFCLGRALLAYSGANRSQHAWACWNKILEIDEPDPVPTRYNKLVQGLSHAKDTQLAVEVFNHIRKLFEPVQIAQGAYTTAIRAHGRLGNTQQAVDLFDEYVDSCQEKRHISRRVGIYLALFNALSRDTVRDPDLNTSDAKRAWQIMSENVPVVLPPAYASLAGVFASTGEMETLDELMEHAERSWGATAQEARQEEMDDEDDDAMESVAVFDGEEVELGSDNDVLLFNGVISGLSKARDDQTANIEGYLVIMKERRLTLTDSIVRATTDACVRFKNWKLINRLRKMVDVEELKSAEICLGDTVSKLLEAGAWESAREWLMLGHRHGLRPPVRRKMELLREMAEIKSKEWRIAYALALETMSFRRLAQNNVDSVADASDVCMGADRPDLAIKLFDTAAGHASLRFYRNYQRDVERGLDVKQNVTPVIIPLRMYKNAILALMRQPANEDPEAGGSWRMAKAERICRQMLQVHGKNLDGEALSLAISIKATAGDDDDVGALYQTMRALGLQPNSYAQNAAIVAFSRQRRTDEVLAVMDELKSKLGPNGEISRVESNVAKTLLRSLAFAHEDDALRDAAQSLPGCDMDLAVRSLANMNRLTSAVEMFDDTVSSDMLGLLIHRICQSDSHDPVLAAALLLKYARLHGLSEVGPPSRVLRVTNALIENGDLVDAEKVLQLYLDGSSGVSLKEMPPYFQQQAIEMLLFIYGEFGRFDAMRSLFNKELLGFPIEVAHYEAAMEYCAQSRDELGGAVASLRLFETLRTHGFVQPSGYSYLLTLQSCLRLERLEPANASSAKSTGQVILDDVREHGFKGNLMKELSMQVKAALDKEQGKQLQLSLRIKKKTEDSDDTAESSVIAPAELAQLALFCHRHGLPMKVELVDQLLTMHKLFLPAIANELAFVKRSLEEGFGVVTAPGASKLPKTIKVKKPRAPKAKSAARVMAKVGPKRHRSKSYEAAMRAAQDARWGAVLEPLTPED